MKKIVYESEEVLIGIRDGDFVAACDFDMRVNKEGDFDGDFENNELKSFKKGDKLKQSLAIRLLRRLPEWVEKPEGKEVEDKDIDKAEKEAKPTKKELISDWYAKNKSAQVKKLEELGLTEKEIKDLTYEKMRVEKIVEMII